MNMNTADMSRRSFIMGTMAAATFGIAGCASPTVGGSSDGPSDAASASALASAGADQGWDGEYDVIVCGGGMAGQCATVATLTESDSATVLILEKGDGPRGNSAYAAGYTIFADDADEVLVHLKAMDGRAETPDDVLAAFAEGLVENKTWFTDLGAKDEWLVFEGPGASVGEMLDSVPYDFPELPNYDAMGFVHFDDAVEGGFRTTTAFLTQVIEERRGDRLDYLVETPLERLIRNPETGVVEGVVAGGKRFRARGGVVLATGGFEQNAEMRFTYTGVREAYPSVDSLNTGDGILAAQAIGADLWRMRGGQLYWIAPRNLDNTRFLNVDSFYTPKAAGITVGVNGRRFYMDLDGAVTCSELGAADGDLRTVVGWRHAMVNMGGQWALVNPMPERAWFVFDQAALDATGFLDGVCEDPAAEGWAYAAQTVEELAALIDVPADELAQTVATWNRSCEEGADTAFYRPASSLNPVSTAPYYAMLCVAQFENTNGGPRRGADAGVIDVWGEPIPHLYECGELGSVWGECFQGGGDYADCAAFGRIAARSCLANLA